MWRSPDLSRPPSAPRARSAPSSWAGPSFLAQANQGLLDTFDCPDPAAAAPRRAITTTPLQALTLWNNGFALRAAEAFASRVEKETEGAEKQVRRAWQLAYQRDPTAKELELATKLVADHGLKALCRVLYNSNEFVTVE